MKSQKTTRIEQGKSLTLAFVRWSLPALLFSAACVTPLMAQEIEILTPPTEHVRQAHDVAVPPETVTLYDNMILPFLPDRGAGPDARDELIAQPFLTGEYDNVSAVDIDLNGRRGSATGELSVEIWDDNGSGIPGKLVGVLGVLDMASLRNQWTHYMFDNPVTGLRPHTKYFVLLDFSAGSHLVEVATYESALGSKGADLLLAKFRPGNTWRPMNDYFTGNFFSYMQMTIVSAATTVVDFNGDGIVGSADVSLMIEHWNTDNPLYDISPEPFGDGIVDVQDLIFLSEHLFEQVDDPTLMAHWALDEAEGDFAEDGVGDNLGYVIGGPVWQPDAGQVNGAIQLDGVDDVIVAGPPLNPADGPFSVFVWVKGGAARQAIISEPAGPDWLSLDPLTGHLMTELTKPGRGAGPLQSQAVIADGDWHRIGLVWDGLYRTLYVDGVVVAEDTQDSLTNPGSGFYIGTGKAMAPGTYFGGLIDDVRIYNRAIVP